MKTRELSTAFAIAQTRSPDVAPVPARFDPGLTDETTLLNALHNSAIGRDQIIQRPMGMMAEATNPM